MLRSVHGIRLIPLVATVLVVMIDPTGHHIRGQEVFIKTGLWTVGRPTAAPLGVSSAIMVLSTSNDGTTLRKR